MPEFICSKDECELVPFINGVLVVEHWSGGIYRLHQADELICPRCGFRLVGKYASKVLFESWQIPQANAFYQEALRNPEHRLLIRHNFENGEQRRLWYEQNPEPA